MSRQAYSLTTTEHRSHDLPQRPRRRKSQPGLRQQRHNTGPVHDRAIPLLDHVTLPDMEYDEGKSMHQSQQIETIGDPAVKRL